jgi:hypothetical protein
MAKKFLTIFYTLIKLFLGQIFRLLSDTTEALWGLQQKAIDLKCTHAHHILADIFSLLT